MKVTINYTHDHWDPADNTSNRTLMVKHIIHLESGTFRGSKFSSLH